MTELYYHETDGIKKILGLRLYIRPCALQQISKREEQGSNVRINCSTKHYGILKRIA